MEDLSTHSDAVVSGARFQCKIRFHLVPFNLLLQSELSVLGLGGGSSTWDETLQQGSRHHQVSTLGSAC